MAMTEEEIELLAQRLTQQFYELGLIEGGKRKPFKHPDKTNRGRKEGMDALNNIARRSLVGLRRYRSSKNSDQLVVHDSTPVTKDTEWILQAMLFGDRGEQFIANFLYPAELDSSKGAITDQDNYYQFEAPRAGEVRRIKLLGQGSGGATAQLHLLSKDPATEGYDPTTDERYHVAGPITSISLASVASTGWKSVYDALHVNSDYKNDDLDSDNRPMEKMYAYIVPDAGTYLWWLRVWIDTKGW